MERRKLDVLCVQETKWKGSTGRELGQGYKLYYNGSDSARNGVVVIVKGGLLGTSGTS
jgi:exonuclease III